MKQYQPRQLWSGFQEQLRHVPTEEAFEMLGGQALIDKYIMYDHTGKPSMVNTAWVMNAYVFHRPLPQQNHKATLELTGHGWDIVITDLLTAELSEQRIAHQLGHLLVMKHDIHENKELYPIGEIYAESNIAVESLSNYLASHFLSHS